MSMTVPLVRVLVILDPYFVGVRAQKLPIKDHFMDAESEKFFKKLTWQLQIY